MKLTKYFKTPLEQTIEEHYLMNDILHPENLQIEKIAAIFGVDVIYHIHGTFSDNEERVIFLNQYEDLTTQRMVFFHELCHVVRHSGDQRWMPKLFREAQESDAERFSLYAALPFFMLEKMQLPVQKDEAASKIANEFHIFLEFAKQRLDQVRERIAGVELLAAFTYTSATLDNQETTVNEVPDIDQEYLPQPRIRAFYDINDYSRPHTLVIEQREGFNWDEPLFVEVDRNYKSCDIPSYLSRDGAFVKSDDLTISRSPKQGVNINMSRVAWRNGTTSRRIFLPMEAVDDALNF